MDHISKHLNQVSGNEQQQQENNMSNQMISNLWERFIHIYGHKFASAYGESAFIDCIITETAKTWASGLRGITGDQIANGLRECVDCGESWPPTLPEFVSMCKGKKINDFGLDYIPECYRETNRERLIESDENKEKHRAAYKKGIAGLKDILK